MSNHAFRESWAAQYGNANPQIVCVGINYADHAAEGGREAPKAPLLFAKLPNTLVIVTLVSNFGTFLLYMITCIICIVAFREHHMFHGFKHFVVPIFGLVANLACMLFYLIGPLMVSGMSTKEPLIALGVCAAWGIYGGIYFLRASKAKSKSVLLTEKVAQTS